MINKLRPGSGTYPDYYKHYLPLVKEDNILTALENNWKEISATLASVQESHEDYAYAEGKWTVKQLALHICDTERILAYRALRFARRDPQQPLPFDEDHYALHSQAEKRTLKDIIEEYSTVRQSTISLFRSFSDETLLNIGNTAIGKVTVLALGFMICGHAMHHINVLKERYLASVSQLE